MKSLLLDALAVEINVRMAIGFDEFLAEAELFLKRGDAGRFVPLVRVHIFRRDAE